METMRKAGPGLTGEAEGLAGRGLCQPQHGQPQVGHCQDGDVIDGRPDHTRGRSVLLERLKMNWQRHRKLSKQKKTIIYPGNNTKL